MYGKLGIRKRYVQKSEERANVNDPDEKAITVLQDWLQREGSKATRGAILTALEQCQLNNSMETLQSKWTSRIETGEFLLIV